MITRVLPREEWGRLSHTGIQLLAPAVRPEDVEIVVVEDGERIVGMLGTYRITHFEGLWIDPEYRGNAGLARRLIRAGIESARKWATDWVWGASGSSESDEMMTRVGGVKMPTDTFVIPI